MYEPNGVNRKVYAFASISKNNPLHRGARLLRRLRRRKPRSTGARGRRAESAAERRLALCSSSTRPPSKRRVPSPRSCAVQTYCPVDDLSSRSCKRHEMTRSSGSAWPTLQLSSAIMPRSFDGEFPRCPPSTEADANSSRLPASCVRGKTSLAKSPRQTRMPCCKGGKEEAPQSPRADSHGFCVGKRSVFQASKITPASDGLGADRRCRRPIGLGREP